MASDTYASDTYRGGTTAYGTDRTVYAESPRYRDPGGIAFVWIAWALAFAFWAFTMSSFFGILSALGSGAPGGIEGGMDAGGAAWFLMEVVGVIVLAGALLWGMARYMTRDKRLDPLTEASTAALYDAEERGPVEDTIDPARRH